MKIYISGKITGEPHYKKKFEEATNRLEEQGHDVFNPADIELPAGATHEDYMTVCMIILKLCDAIYMLPDWKESKGACREYGYALGAGMKIYTEEEFNESIIDGTVARMVKALGGE